MSIRSRIAAAIFLTSAVTASLFGWMHYRDASALLEMQLRTRAESMVDSFQVELRQTEQELAKELHQILGANAALPRAVTGPNAGARYRWTLERGQRGNLDILKVLAADGTILSSRHWPASFGVVDATAQAYAAEDAVEGLVQEATLEGSVLSLQMWRKVTTRDGQVFYLVVGRFLGPRSLDRSLARTDADLLVICVAQFKKCWQSLRHPNLRNRLKVTGGRPRADGFHFVSNTLFAGQRHQANLWVGVDTLPLMTLGKNVLVRIMLVGVGGLVLSLLLGFILGHKIGKPLSLLSTASLRLADGKLDARVEAPPQAVREVAQLVDSFNLMAAQLQQSRHKLQHAERVATWQEIARGLAHELKNPLTPILGALKVVRRAREKSHPEFDTILNEQSLAVEEEVMRLKSMADSFARFARLPEPQPAPVCLLQVLETVLSLYAGAQGVVVTSTFPDEAPMVADGERLRTLFSNLVKNGVDAMEAVGQMNVAVCVTFVSGISGYEIRVEDTGPGISEEVRDKLFMPYVTTKANRGTGLGLALALRIVTEMGGQIRLDSQYKSGAAFVVWLPAVSI